MKDEIATELNSLLADVVLFKLSSGKEAYSLNDFCEAIDICPLCTGKVFHENVRTVLLPMNDLFTRVHVIELDAVLAVLVIVDNERTQKIRNLLMQFMKEDEDDGLLRSFLEDN
jgi:hypothetical protein